MKKIKQLMVFIASPGDVDEERDAVRDVCEQLNKSPLIREKCLLLHPVGWEDAIPSPGRPQEIINRLVEECDLFVCIFCKRFGTPTGKKESGTLEEFFLAYDLWKTLKKPHIMFYFKEVKIKSAKELNDLQLQKVFGLREKIENDRLLLFGEFESTHDFRKKNSKGYRKLDCPIYFKMQDSQYTGKRNFS